MGQGILANSPAVPLSVTRPASSCQSCSLGRGPGATSTAQERLSRMDQRTSPQQAAPHPSPRPA